MGLKKVIIVPGNGCTPIDECNWYSWLQDELTNRLKGVEVIAKDMPDPYQAKEKIWVPFLLELMGNDNEETILIGHSSGAEAIMRLAEKTKVRAIVLVSACWTDLGEPSETISGYYSRPWLWNQIVSNCGWILQFGSTNDPFIPISEAHHVRDNLSPKVEFLEYTKEGHFMSQSSNTILKELLRKLEKEKDL